MTKRKQKVNSVIFLSEPKLTKINVKWEFYFTFTNRITVTRKRTSLFGEMWKFVVNQIVGKDM